MANAGTMALHHFGEGDRILALHPAVEPAFEAVLRRYILSRELPHLRIGALSSGSPDAFASSRSHIDSGRPRNGACRTLEQAAGNAAAQFSLDFLTPTAFNLGYDHDSDESGARSIAPTPTLLFGTLRREWHQARWRRAGDEFDAWVRQANVEIEQAGHSHRAAGVEGHPVTGFVGRVRVHRARR